MESKLFSGNIYPLMVSALVEGYAEFSDEAIKAEEEKLLAEKKLAEMKLNAIEQIKKRNS